MKLASQHQSVGRTKLSQAIFIDIYMKHGKG